VEDLRPDAVLVHLGMPGISGMEILAKIHNMDPAVAPPEGCCVIGESYALPISLVRYCLRASFTQAVCGRQAVSRRQGSTKSRIR